MNAVPNVDWRRGTAAGLLVVFVSFAAYVPAVLGAVAVPEGHEKLLRYGVVCVLLAPITALSVYAILKAVIGGRARPAWIGFAYPHRVISSVLLFFPLAFVALFVAGILTTVTGLQDEPTTAVDLTTKPEGGEAVPHLLRRRRRSLGGGNGLPRAGLLVAGHPVRLLAGRDRLVGRLVGAAPRARRADRVHRRRHRLVLAPRSHRIDTARRGAAWAVELDRVGVQRRRGLRDHLRRRCSHSPSPRR